MAKVNEMGGVYVPYWTFNSSVYSQWTAERGWHYYETETYTTTENNQRVTRTRQVQKTRWEPAFGSRSDWYEQYCTNAPAARQKRATLPSPIFARVVHPLPDRVVGRNRP